jgi:hypothetical protein
LLSNLYLNEVDRMLERAKEITRYGKHTCIEYARFADDCVPRTHDLRFGKCDAAREMRAGPSKPACRSRLQTTLSCMGQESVW